MKYRSQQHRYIYPGSTGQGHIFSVGSDVGFCGVRKDTLKKKAKENEERLVNVLRFKEDQALCKRCQNVMKKSLAEKYNLDW